MAGLLDGDTAGDDDLAEYRRRITTLPMGERQVSLDEFRYQRALTALREEMLTRARPAQLPGALGDLSAASQQGSAGTASPYAPPGLLSPGSNPAGTLMSPPTTGDFSSRMTGPLSANIEDRRGDPSWVVPGWQNVAKWLEPERKVWFPDQFPGGAPTTATGPLVYGRR
jgi:hypothetical protein